MTKKKMVFKIPSIFHYLVTSFLFTLLLKFYLAIDSNHLYQDYEA